MKEKQGTKLCKHCKTEIPAGAKVCPNCRKKQGGALKWVVIAIIALFIISAISGGKDKGAEQASSTSDSKEVADSKKETAETEAPVEYISVTADELSDALEENALKAQETYGENYLEISGKLGTIDSNGKYIGIDSDKDFDFTNIQCYIQSDEQKEVIMEMSRGDAITVKGYCKDVGEIIGYQIDIDSIE